MAFFEWRDSLSVQIPSIDRQHKMLIGYINQLDALIQKGGASKFEIKDILRNLVSYTVMHFKYEEIIFDVHKYPASDDHKRYHQSLAGRVVEFNERFEKGDPTVGPELLDFLKDWLNHHIMEEDMAFANYFQEKNIVLQ